MIGALKKRWQNGVLHRVYDLGDAYGRGRFCIMFSGLLSGIVGQLTGGLFLTSFLLLYGLDKAQIGILIFVPYMATLLNVFSPLLLERFSKRRWILILMKLAYYIINIVGVTLLPTVVKGRKEMVTGFVLLVLIANIINQLASSGWSAWTVAFLPEEVRVDYFQTTTCIQNAFLWVVALGVSVVGDILSGTGYELLLLTVVRYVAFIMGIVDCAIWLIPKEFPYKRSAKLKWSNIFILPVKNKKFLLVAFMLAMYNFSANLPSATLNAYLLQNVKVSYSLINGINATYFLFFLFFGGMWKKFIQKHYWYKALAFEMLLEAVSAFCYSFVTENTVWLYIIVRLAQHVLGVLLCALSTSVLYSVLPQEDQTNYLSFYTIVVNASVFISLMLGTFLAIVMGDASVCVFGVGFSSTQLCLVGCSVGEIMTALMAYGLSKKYVPQDINNDNALKIHK